MSLRPDHKALIFLGAVAVLGAGVRVSRAASRSVSSPSTQPALDRQMASADSAAKRRSVRHRSEDVRALAAGDGPPADREQWSSDSASSPPDSAQGKPSRKKAAEPHTGSGLHQWKARSRRRDRRADRLAAGRDRRRSPNASRRIECGADRSSVSTDCGGSAVSGRRCAKHLDSLVTFSGVYTQGASQDSTIRARVRKPSRGGLRDLRRREQRRRHQRRRASESRVAARRLGNERRRRGERRQRAFAR